MKKIQTVLLTPQRNDAGQIIGMNIDASPDVNFTMEDLHTILKFAEITIGRTRAELRRMEELAKTDRN